MLIVALKSILIFLKFTNRKLHKINLTNRLYKGNTKFNKTNTFEQTTTPINGYISFVDKNNISESLSSLERVWNIITDALPNK